MNAVVARQLLWRNEEDFETESPKFELQDIKFLSPPYSRIYF